MTVRTVLLSIAAAVAALGLAACSKGADAGADANVKIDPYLADVTMGQDSAPVTLVEYASLTCPHCRDFWKQEFPNLKANYIDTGKVKYTLRELPTPPVDVAIAAAAIARCAGKDQYYDVIEDVYSNYHEMMDAINSPRGAAPILVEIGGRHGLSPEQVAACARSKAVRDYINKEIAEKPDYVNSTPTLILDGDHVTDLRYDNLTKLIDAKLNPGAAPAETPAPAADTPAKPAD